MNEREIFIETLKKQTAAERAAYLNEVCADDARMRQHVEILIREHENLGSFLESPAQAHTTLDLPVNTEGCGSVIGPYKLLQQIGEGGMGSVFMAEQTEPVRRKVALKIIKPGMDSKQVIARFEAERQALAMMDHVNIARVFDGGATENGRPYFVMELVHGVPVTKYCDDNHLTPRERLELFVPVCHAIQHAHQKGIIHRDIKPSNVMVTLYDGKPVPKVIDFGVAKAIEQKLTERTLFTQYGSMVGTLEYMSPEQAEMSALGVDTRSDIYSLGVLLYELLTGSTPLDRKRMREAGFGEILRIIKEEEPPKPSTRLSDSGETLASISAQRQMEPAKLTKLVKGELDWIVMKTLEKDRNRRYETANHFAADVQRYLADEPVQACPPSAGYRLRKFARRNKGPVTAVIAFAALLVLGTVGTSIGLAWALQAEHKSTLAAEAEAKQRLRAEMAYEEEVKQRRRARKAVDDMYTKVAERWLDQQPHMEGVQQEFLETALAYYEDFVRESGTDPEVASEAAVAYRRMGDMYYKLGRFDRAGGCYERAVEQFQSLATAHPEEPSHRRELAHSCMQHGFLLWRAGQKRAGAENTRRAIRLQAELVADSRPDSGDRHSLAHAYTNLGNISISLGRPADIEDSYRAAIRLERALLAHVPEVPGYRDELGRACLDLGDFLLKAGRMREAEEYYRESLGLREKLVAEFPAIPVYRRQLARSLLGVAEWSRAAASIPPAVKAYGRAQEVMGRLTEDFPKVAEYPFELARAFAGLALLRSDCGDWTAAEALLREAVRHQRAATEMSPNPHFKGILHAYQGRHLDALVRLGRYQEAARTADEVFRVSLQDGRPNLKVVGVLVRCAAAADRDQSIPPAERRLAAGRYTDQAREFIREVTVNCADSPEQFNDLAWVLATCPNPQLRNPELAVKFSQAATQRFPASVRAWNTHGAALYRAGDCKEAINALKKSMELSGGGNGFDLFFLAMACSQSGAKDEARARQYYEQAVDWMDKNDRTNEELNRFREEAAVLLNIAEQPKAKKSEAP